VNAAGAVLGYLLLAALSALLVREELTIPPRAGTAVPEQRSDQTRPPTD
jgi:hypothetical protein